MKQYHLTVYARVDNQGEIVGWGLCEPGSEPTSHNVAIFNEETDRWESSYDQEVKAWPKVESDLYARLKPRGVL